MPLVGNLRDFALHDFLYLVDRGYKTGSLLLKRPNDGAALFFDRGKLISVTRPQRKELLGELLVRIGKISPNQCDAAIKAQNNGNIRPLGQILIEQGTISQEELQACIKQQIEEAVYELFAWHEGEFKFEAGMKPAIDEVQAITPIPVENLIMEGVRRVDEMSRIKERIPNNDVLVVFTERPDQKATNINMTADEWRVFARINGKTTINEIAQKTGLSPFEVSHVVFGFITAGLAEVRRPAPVAPPPTAAGTPAVGANGRPVPANRPAPPPIKKGLVGRLIERIRGM